MRPDSQPAAAGWRNSGAAIFDHLPDNRQSLLGIDEDGDEAWLIRGISQKLYTCPGCRTGIEIGEDHVVVQTVFKAGGTQHQHWHRECAHAHLLPRLRRVKPVNAAEAERERLERRGSRPAGKRGRRTPRR